MTSSTPNTEILKQVRIAFSEHQRESGGKRRHYPLRLRRLASSAVDYGHKPKAVAKAVGVSGQSVINWCRMERILPQKPNPVVAPTPVELKVIQFRERAEAVPLVSPPAIVRILFRGGACMECPVSLVSPELVAALHGGTL